MKVEEDRYAAVDRAITHRAEGLREQVKARFPDEADWGLIFCLVNAAVAEEAVYWAAELERMTDGIAAHFPRFAPALRLVAHHVRYGADLQAVECSEECRIGGDPPDAA